MSFKDVRDLSDHLKLLGYPNNFPLSSLYTNYGGLNSFKVVADVLQWLVGRLEPGATIPGSTKNETDRILLIRSATEFFVTKTGVKVNPRKLYASSSAAAKELQKITSLLITTPSAEDEQNDENLRSLAPIDLGDKIDELRRARELSSELTNRGAALYDLLSKEMVNKETRSIQSSRIMEISAVEKALRNAISSAQLKLQSAKTQLETSRVEKQAASSKLQRKKAELERSKQRLDALQKIRPAHMKEYEELEEELRGLFQQYFLRVRCRDALKSQLNSRIKSPTPIATPVIKATENSITFIPEGLIDDDDEDDDLDEIDDDDMTISGMMGRDEPPGAKEKDLGVGPKPEEKREVRVRPTTGRLKPRTGTTVGRHKIIGSMLGDPDDDILDSSLGSGNSDSEIELGGNEFGLNSDDDISLSKLTGEVAPKPPPKNDHSDEDF
ncbi:unnamed protein product [Hermetia illucens]|uniref:Clusterin-associated protein 1 n=1 Tax=Hermetia illucens TaxID=343691 RepID=A0A7R8V1Q0_HERIL|nr:clusterin-associated protein 1 [Hermetia illucens]CAD7091181.1 unnamed protein product [Hermetia illucens]